MENQDENKIDLGKYVSAICRAAKKLRKYLVLLVVLCVVLAEIKTYFFFDTVYSSQALFMAYNSKQTISLSSNKQDDDFVSTFNNILGGSMMRNMVIEELKLDPALPFPAQINLHRIPDTNLIQMVVTADDPDIAYEVADCILSQYNQVTQQVISDARLTVVDTPMLAKGPDASPDYIKSFVKGTFVGVFLCVLTVFLYAFMRKTVIDSDDVENKLHMDMLAKIQYQPGRGQGPEALFLTNPHINYSIRKSFYDISMAIEKKHREDGSQVFMVTSAVPGEGKTMVALNTALELAKHGRQVALVDLNLRKNSIYDGGAGEKLKNKINQYLASYQQPPLGIIYSHSVSADAIDILESKRFEQVIASARSCYDYVIMDVPSLHIVQDALIVARLADSAIVTIQQDQDTCADVLDALDDLNANTESILGIVLNGVKPTMFDPEHGTYGYGSGYGYGYGYGEKRRQPKNKKN